MGRLTYREVKTRRDQSMSGKSGQAEPPEVNAGQDPDGKVKPRPVESQCPYRNDGRGRKRWLISDSLVRVVGENIACDKRPYEGGS